MYGVSAQPYYYNNRQVGSMYSYPPAMPASQQLPHPSALFQQYNPNYQQQQQLQLQQQQIQDQNLDTKGYHSHLMARFVANSAYDILHEYVPAISDIFVQKLVSVLDATRLPKSSVLLGLTYLYRKKTMAAMTRQGELQYGLADERRIFLYIIISLIVSNKYNDDNTFTNRSWSNATGIAIEELNKCERDWLLDCNYDLHFKVKSNSAYSSNESSSYQSNGYPSQFETRPWLLSLGNYNTFFNPHCQIPKDEVYGKNDTVRKALTNGLQDYSCIESMYNHYETHRSLPSPTRSSFENQPPSNPYYRSSNVNASSGSNHYGSNNYNTYNSTGAAYLSSNPYYTSATAPNADNQNYMYYSNNNVASNSAIQYDDRQGQGHGYSTSFNNGLPTPKSPYGHGLALTSNDGYHQQQSQRYSPSEYAYNNGNAGYSRSPSGFRRTLSGSSSSFALNRYGNTSNNNSGTGNLNSDYLMLSNTHNGDAHNYRKSTLPPPLVPITNPANNNYNYTNYNPNNIGQVTQLPPLSFVSDYYPAASFGGQDNGLSGPRYSATARPFNFGNSFKDETSSYDYFGRLQDNKSITSGRFSNRSFPFFV